MHDPDAELSISERHATETNFRTISERGLFVCYNTDFLAVFVRQQSALTMKLQHEYYLHHRGRTNQQLLACERKATSEYPNLVVEPSVAGNSSRWCEIHCRLKHSCEKRTKAFR